MDVAAVERQLESLSASHRAVERRLEAATDENRRILSDIQGQRHYQQSTSHDIAKLQRQLAAAADEASALRVRLSVLEAERARVRPAAIIATTSTTATTRNT
jgi:chromosome segregation ATPase